MMDEDLYPEITINGEKIKRNELVPEDLQHKIKGKTLEVYYYLVMNQGKHGVRKLQRELDYNSASLVSYHLDRLLDYELISKTNEGKYYVEVDPAKLGELENFIIIAGKYIPKISMYGYQAFSQIIVAIIFLLLNVQPIVWAIYLIASSTGFLIFILRDSLAVLNKIRP